MSKKYALLSGRTDHFCSMQVSMRVLAFKTMTAELSTCPLGFTSVLEGLEHIFIAFFQTILSQIFLNVKTFGCLVVKKRRFHKLSKIPLHWARMLCNLSKSCLPNSPTKIWHLPKIAHFTQQIKISGNEECHLQIQLCIL